MCNGPKSAWKALYNKVLSMEKYTGGMFRPDLDTPCGPPCAFDDLLDGDRLSFAG